MTSFKSVQAAGEIFLLPSEPPACIDILDYPGTAEEAVTFLQVMLGPGGLKRLDAAFDDGRIDTLGVSRLVFRITAQYIPVPAEAMI